MTADEDELDEMAALGLEYTFSEAAAMGVPPEEYWPPDPYEPKCSLCGAHHYGGGCS